MKKYALLLTTLAFLSCTKNDPTPEIDQEGTGTATLTFTPVEEVITNGTKNYEINASESPQSITFTGAQLLAPVNAHLDLHVGETYKMELTTTDFAGRASQQTFVERGDTHQAFLLGATPESISFTYGDNNVGVTAYITVLKEANRTTMRYIMRHLNNGVKSRITASDWNNTNYTQFVGANDLDLRFDLHFIDHDHAHND